MRCIASFAVFIAALLVTTFPATAFEGARVLPDGTIELTNASTRVVLDPNVGGRVLVYELNGTDALYHAPEHPAEGERTFTPDAGRFDIGPEQTRKRGAVLWSGTWTGVVAGDRAARMTSGFDPESGVRLIRDFELAADSSHLSCAQTIINESEEPKRYNHWSRTLATGHGICIVPLGDYSRFPNGYIYYGPGPVLNVRHDPHPGLRVREGFLEILDTPPEPKFGIDSYAGWFGYITRDDLLFVKKFPVYPDRPYGEVAAYTISIWYYEDVTCELEPIGPTEYLRPGERAVFTEEWWLLPYDFPGSRDVDLDAFERYVMDNTD